MAIALSFPKYKQISENANSEDEFSFPECLFIYAFYFGVLSLGFYDSSLWILSAPSTANYLSVS